MHDRQLVTIVVLPGDLVVAEHVSGRLVKPVRRDPVLVGDVIVVSHDAVVTERRTARKKWYSSRAIPHYHQELVHLGVEPPAVVQVERQETPGIMISAGLMAAGFSRGNTLTTHLDEQASGRTFRILSMARTLAFTMCLSGRHAKA